MNHLTILLVFEVLLLVQSNNLTCEQFGICSITINETEFNCGEDCENLSRADNLLDLDGFWTCLCGWGGSGIVFPESKRDVLTFLLELYVCQSYHVSLVKSHESPRLESERPDKGTAVNEELSTTIPRATVTGTAVNEEISTTMTRATFTGTAVNEKMSTPMRRTTITGTAVKDKITEIRSSSTITDIHIAMAITGSLSGTFAIIAIISSIKKMFGNGRVKGQEDKNTEAAMEYGRGYVENNLFELENAESGFVFKNKSPLDHHDLKHYVHRD